MKRAAIGVFVIAVLGLGAARAESLPDPRRVETLVQDLTNAFRREHGLQPVRPDERLIATARDFAQFMARTLAYGHEADGRSPSQRAEAHGYDYCLVNENLAYLYSSEGFSSPQLAAGLVDGWKHSPGHRRNLLEEGATQSAIAVARGKNGYWYAVQLFGRPRSEQVVWRLRNATGGTLRYRVAGESFTLSANASAEHTRCKAEALAIEGGPAGLVARRGDHLVARRVSGRIALEREKR